jgi:hypothetical protein
MLNVFERPIWATGMVACAVVVAVSVSSGAATSEGSTVSDCMAFEQNAVDDGVEYRLENHCERHVTCNVKWTLYCGDKPPLRVIKSSSSASIAPSAQRSITASAAACAHEGWEISGVVWSCSP